MDGLGDEIYGLPVSGHYDCGYGYGGNIDAQPPPPPAAPEHPLPPPPPPPPEHPLRQYSPTLTNKWSYNTSFDDRDLAIHIEPPRAVSPPVTLPNSFTAQRQDVESESDLSSVSSGSRQMSAFSFENFVTSRSSPATSCSSSTREIRKSRIQPDPLPSHSNPQQLTPTQSAAFAGPRPIQPMKLSRRTVCDSWSGDVIYEISDETKLKLSGRSIHQIREAGNTRSIGTIGFATDSNDIAAILRGRDIYLHRENATSARWLFRPSSLGPVLTKRGTFWYWQKDKVRGGIMLADAKKNGTAIAMIRRDVLSFEKQGLALETVAEICFAAMALAEMARRQTGPELGGDLAASIAQVALGESLEQTNDEGVEKTGKVRRRFTLMLR